MKNRSILLLFAVGLAVLLIGCGPSAEQVNATSTQIAANIYGTQTALAPTATMTFTPSPTATNTPVPTSTPTSTSTPLPTATPTPGLEVAAITLDDLPFGYEGMPASQLESMQQQLPEGATGFGFTDNENFQLIVGLLFPMTSDLPQIDTALPEFVNMYATIFGADKDIKDLAGFENIGEERAAITSSGAMAGFTLRWENVAFYRDQVVVVLIVGYQEGTTPDITAIDLSQLLDERIMNYNDPLEFPAAKNADAISGTWVGDLVAADKKIYSNVSLELTTACTASNNCGTVSLADLPCSGEVVLESTSGNTFVFAEQNMAGSDECTEGVHGYARLLANGKLFIRLETTDPSVPKFITKAILEKQ